MSRILCISHSSLRAGAEKAFFEMIKALYATENQIVCVFPEEGPLIDLCRPYIKTYVIIPLPWWFGYNMGILKKIKLLIKIFRSSYQIKKCIEKFGSERVIVNTIAIPSGAIGSKLAGRKTYWYLHELGDDGFSLIFGERFSKKMVEKLSDRVLCNSKYVQSQFTRYISSKKLVLAYQSVDINVIDLARDNSFITFGLVGRLSQQKGQEEAVRALMKLHLNNVRLILIGSDRNKYAEQLKTLVSENSLTGKVIFTGEIADPNNIYSQLDVLISCGTKEAFGRTSVEAMKCGIPVIVPDAFGYSELVENGINGLCYQSGNIEDLARKMTLLLDDSLRITLGEKGKELALNKFNTNNFAGSLKNALQIA